MECVQGCLALLPRLLLLLLRLLLLLVLSSC
jgi:hypothetical protein